MKVVIILAALLVVSQAAKTFCPKTVCDSGLADNTCYSVTNTADTYEIKIKNCGTGKYCNVSNFVNPANGATATCATASGGSGTSPTNLKPGQGCTEAKECASGTCTSNLCVGRTEGQDCVAWSSTDKLDEICGANLVCKTAKCAKGETAGKDCTAASDCENRLGCIGGKCVALSTVDKGDACTGDYYCKAGFICSTADAKCADAPAYSTGSFGASCTANDQCSGDCQCGLANPDGNGSCGLLDGGYGKTEIDKIRTSITASTFGCPLAFSKTTNGGCAGTYDLPTFAAQKTESCYKDFNIDGGMLPQPGSSAFGLYASVLGFVAYLLA